MVGPTVHPDLFSRVIRLRFLQILLSADSAKMYRQFAIEEHDRLPQSSLKRYTTGSNQASEIDPCDVWNSILSVSIKEMTSRNRHNDNR